MALAIVLVAGLGGVVYALLGSGPGARASDRSSAASRTAGGGAPRRVSGRPGPSTTAPDAIATTTPTSAPGTLPQTDTLPSPSTPQFQAEIIDLWKGVASGSLTAALPAFFPEGAYLQLKTITDPGTDYEHRLLHLFGLDVQAAHQLLGAAPGSATLVTVNVPMQYAHWVPPGVCDNSIGYYEVPNSRVVYREGGVVRSFGIASMISWRGAWYVVHLGAVLRPTTTSEGVVDDPSTGPGTSAYSSTC